MKKTVFSLLFLLLFSGVASGFSAKEVYREVSPRVVLIVAGQKAAGNIVGAGSIISSDGFVVTNAHVVVDKKTGRPFGRISVFLKPERISGNLGKDLKDPHEGVVVSYDVGLDLALVRVRGLPRVPPPVTLADPREIMTGEEVVAIGHPEQGGLWTLTYGRISGSIDNQGNVRGKDVFQTDTSVNRGNSGGPLLDRRGYMVGMTTNVARRGAGDLAITGVNFAVKSSVIRNWAGRQGLVLSYGPETLGDLDALRETAGGSVGTGPAGPGLSGKDSPPGRTDADLPGPDMKAGDMESDTILTPRRPYSYDELLMEAERDLEEMMEEMREKIRKKKN
jgi:serine protease Do